MAYSVYCSGSCSYLLRYQDCEGKALITCPQVILTLNNKCQCLPKGDATAFYVISKLFPRNLIRSRWHVDIRRSSKYNIVGLQQVTQNVHYCIFVLQIA